MDGLTEKTLTTSRGLTYRYYFSNDPSEVNKAQPTLLFLHGWPDGAHVWQYVIPRLKSLKLPLLAPDLLGYGGTSKPTDPKEYNWRLMAKDVDEILQAESILKIIPISHDWGCLMGSRIPLLYPERCVANVFLNVAYATPTGNHVELDALNKLSESLFGYPRFAYWELFCSDEAPEIFREHIDSVWHALHGAGNNWMYDMFCVRGAMNDFLLRDGKTELKPYARNDQLRDQWMGQMEEGGFAAPFCWYKASVQNVQSEEDAKLPTGTGKIDTPVLYIGCTGDSVCRTETIRGPQGAGLLPDLTVHEIESNHWCPYEKPEEVAGLIEEFLREKELLDRD